MARHNINDPINARLSNIELKLKQYNHGGGSGGGSGGGGGGGDGGNNGGHPLTDGDKGDITVSSNGTVWNIDAGVITTTELGGDITTAGKALLDDDDAAAQRTTLGLGTAATANTSAFAAASHTHTIADVTNLQTTLDGKAALSHTHALSDLTQSAATTGQVPTWNGSAWAPATPSGVGIFGPLPAIIPYTGQRISQLLVADTLSTFTPTNGRIVWAPIIRGHDYTVTAIGCYVTTAATTIPSILSVAIYASDPTNGRPTGTPIWDMYLTNASNGLDITSTGEKKYILPTPLDLTAYTQYWIASYISWSGATIPKVRGINRISLPVIFDKTAGTTTDGIVGLHRGTNPISGGTPYPNVTALPLTGGSNLAAWNTLIPYIWLEV